MPYIDHPLLAKIVVAIVVGVLCLYYLRVLTIAVRHQRLQARMKFKQSELIALSAEVNRLSQDDSHWKQLHQEVSSLDSQGMRQWL
jgi:uncharacterized membrane protein (DUF106 family)